MKKTKRKLALDKETLKQVTGGGIFTAPILFTPSCPGMFTCGWGNSCAPLSCWSQLPVTGC